MGRYMNPGSESFQMARNSQIYVDKTELIGFTNTYIDTKQRYICVSRPRRFGKTMALEMLAAYYDRQADASKVFYGTKISSSKDFDRYSSKYNVLFLNMADMWCDAADINEMLANMKRGILLELLHAYPSLEYIDRNSISSCMNDVYQLTGVKFVILVDEWDVIFRERQKDEDGQKDYLDFLRAWLKDKSYIALCYMTGILPIKKYGKHSALNMFREFSMDSPRDLAEFTGFSAAEVKELCSCYDMDYEECKSWYDGYAFSDELEIYNPLSVVEAMLSRKYANYWNKTESYEALQIYIQMNYGGLRDIITNLMAGGRYVLDTSHYSNDMQNFNSADDVLTLLIHLGYLAYDSSKSEVFIPNNEIRSEFSTSVKASDRFTEVAKAIKNSDELLQATLAGDAKRVAELVGEAHKEMSHLQYNDENALSYAISLAYYTARNKYTVVRELPTGNGFADLVFIPRPFCQDLPALVVELKWNRSTKTAIQQIRKKNYIAGLQDYVGRILLVGVNYSKKTRKHTCRIEKA